HPQTVAHHSCQRCRATLCARCLVAARGESLCSSCATKGSGGRLSGETLTGMRPLAGVKCANHPEKGAEAKCKVCRTSICVTCRFKIRGVSVCPDCATAPRTGISAGRKLLAGFSYGCAVVFSVAIGVAFASATSGDLGGLLVAVLLFSL